MISVEPIVLLKYKTRQILQVILYFRCIYIQVCRFVWIMLSFCVNHAIIASQVDIVNLVLGIDANALTLSLESISNNDFSWQLRNKKINYWLHLKKTETENIPRERERLKNFYSQQIAKYEIYFDNTTKWYNYCDMMFRDN